MNSSQSVEDSQRLQPILISRLSPATSALVLAASVEFSPSLTFYLADFDLHDRCCAFFQVCRRFCANGLPRILVSLYRLIHPSMIPCTTRMNILLYLPQLVVGVCSRDPPSNVLKMSLGPPRRHYYLATSAYYCFSRWYFYVFHSGSL
jgi:hypothetical protein